MVFSGFGDIATFKNGQISLSTMDYSPWSSKNSIDRNWLKKFMQVGIDVKCMHTNFGGRGHGFLILHKSGFGDIATSSKTLVGVAKLLPSLSDHGL